MGIGAIHSGNAIRFNIKEKETNKKKKRNKRKRIRCSNAKEEKKKIKKSFKKIGRKRRK